jgi:N-alpha-acetyltransferase 35, NatC auxiliary subunit
MTLFPTVIHLHRLAVIREIVLSGFQLELYSNNKTLMEQAFAWWFVGRVCEGEIRCLERVVEAAHKGKWSFRVLVCMRV